MLTPEEIERLESFDGGGTPVLTVSLDLAPARQVTRAYRIAFEDLVKETRARLAEPARDDLAREAAVVDAWLQSEELRGKGVVLVSCTPRGFWQAHVLAVGVRDHLAFEPGPDVAPLLELVDGYERYAVALVDREQARLLTVFLGEIEETASVRDDVPGKHDQGGVSQLKYQHHHETHVHWHIKRVTERLADLLRRRRFDRLIPAGPQEATAELRRLLPRARWRATRAVAGGGVHAADVRLAGQRAGAGERDRARRAPGQRRRDRGARSRPAGCARRRRNGRSRSGASLQGEKAQVLEAFERQYITRLLTQHRGNVSRAAQAAGKERRDLGKLLKRHGVDPRVFAA